MAPRNPHHANEPNDPVPKRPNLIISPNLDAALDYDERARNSKISLPDVSAFTGSRHRSYDPTSPVTASSLPPPPRAVRRVNSTRPAQSTPVSPLPHAREEGQSKAPLAWKLNVTAASVSNPYINAPPSLPYMYGSCTQDDVSPPPVKGGEDSPVRPASLTTASPSSSVDGHGSALSESAQSPSNPSFPRHRYLPSLHKVERIIGKGKDAIGKKLSENSFRTSRRASDADTIFRDMPTSPERSCSVTTHGVRETKSRWRGDGETQSPKRDSVTDVTEALDVTPGTRTVGQSDNMAAGYSSYPSSLSSHDPSSSPSSEPRISISSTVYSAPPSVDLFYYNMSGRSASPDRESFIDFASPTFPPQSPPYSSSGAASRPVVAPQAGHTSYSTHTNSNSVSQSSTKPPLPTSPKPNFNRSKAVKTEQGDVPPTTNLLNPRERAERVRKTRKLTQLFGQNPGPGLPTIPFDRSPVREFRVPGGDASSALSARRFHRTALSVSSEVPAVSSDPGQAPWPPEEGTKYLTLSEVGRRHSTPLSPQDVHFISAIDAGERFMHSSRDPEDRIEIGTEEGEPYSDTGSHSGHGRGHGRATFKPMSPSSFMDMSDEDTADGISIILSPAIKHGDRRYRLPMSPSTPSLLSLSPEELAEEERRRKREKLAKLHRFLGSRVPTDLVLGPLGGIPLPAPAQSPLDMMREEEENDLQRMWRRRRRSSSATEFAGKWSEEIDRLKEELNGREKAINVRRAVKMEKLFGIAPPQTLFHTRGTPPPLSPNVSAAGSKDWNNSGSERHDSSSTLTPTPPNVRNVNQSSYKKSKKNGRPGTAESSKPLIASGVDDSPHQIYTTSDVYLHYRHSLNSLTDIIDRDDRESLVELHDYLNNNSVEPPLQYYSRQDETTPLASPSLKSERRRSLPSRTSMTSISSEFSIMAMASPKETTFQLRRRRAAKLTQFFGVDYRDLMREIFESIEKGLEEESGRGTLKPAEVQDLRQTLVDLKSKRNIAT